MKEKTIAFLFGDLFATMHVLLAGILADLGHFGLQLSKYASNSPLLKTN